jgi:hypothetical protein
MILILVFFYLQWLGSVSIGCWEWLEPWVRRGPSQIGTLSHFRFKCWIRCLRRSTLRHLLRRSCSSRVSLSVLLRRFFFLIERWNFQIDFFSKSRVEPLGKFRQSRPGPQWQRGRSASKATCFKIWAEKEGFVLLDIFCVPVDAFVSQGWAKLCKNFGLVFFFLFQLTRLSNASLRSFLPGGLLRPFLEAQPVQLQSLAVNWKTVNPSIPRRRKRTVRRSQRRRRTKRALVQHPKVFLKVIFVFMLCVVAAVRGNFFFRLSVLP